MSSLKGALATTLPTEGIYESQPVHKARHHHSHHHHRLMAVAGVF
jgi:hypothetical protein